MLNKKNNTKQCGASNGLVFKQGLIPADTPNLQGNPWHPGMQLNGVILVKAVMCKDGCNVDNI